MAYRAYRKSVSRRADLTRVDRSGLTRGDAGPALLLSVPTIILRLAFLQESPKKPRTLSTLHPTVSTTTSIVAIQ